jgi:ribosome maturation protein Sdo1
MANQEEVLAYIRQQYPLWVSGARLKIVMADPEVGRKLRQLAKIGMIDAEYMINKEGKHERIARFRGKSLAG